MPIKADMRKVSEDGGGCAPDGVYLLHIAKAFDKVSEAGNDMIKLEMKIKYDATGDKAHAGAMVWDQLVFSGGALPRVKMAYKQLGLPCDDDGMEFSYMDVVGMDIWAVLVTETYDGKANNKVTFDGYHRKYVPDPLPKVDGAFATADTKAATKDDDALPF